MNKFFYIFTNIKMDLERYIDEHFKSYPKMATNYNCIGAFKQNGIYRFDQITFKDTILKNYIIEIHKLEDPYYKNEKLYQLSIRPFIRMYFEYRIFEIVDERYGSIAECIAEIRKILLNEDNKKLMSDGSIMNTSAAEDRQNIVDMESIVLNFV